MESFKDLKGIGKEKDRIRPKTSGVLELIKAKDAIIKSTKDRFGLVINMLRDFEETFYDISLPDFDEKDLSDFLALGNNSGDTVVTGIITGFFLHSLTKKNRELGKPTTFYFDGNGRRFDNLFYGAKDIDNVIINNFEGNYLGAHIGTFDGRSNSVIIINCRGEHPGWFIANEGKAGLVSLINCETETPNFEIGEQTDANFISLSNNRSKNSQYGYGYTTKESHVRLLNLNNNHEDFSLLSNMWGYASGTVGTVYENSHFLPKLPLLDYAKSVAQYFLDSPPEGIVPENRARIEQKVWRMHMRLPTKEPIENFDPDRSCIRDREYFIRPVQDFEGTLQGTFIKKINSINEELATSDSPKELCLQLIQTYEEMKTKGVL